LSTLDFSKLAPPKGETFEGLVRLLGERLGMVADWDGTYAKRTRKSDANATNVIGTLTRGVL
jgi:hypothetical protein